MCELIEVSSDLPAVELKLQGMPKDVAGAARKASIKDRSPSGRLQGSEGMKVRQAQYARKIDRCPRGLLGPGNPPDPGRHRTDAIDLPRDQSYPHLARPAILTNPEVQSDADLAAVPAPSSMSCSGMNLRRSARCLSSQRQGRTTSDLAQAARAATYGAVQLLLSTSTM